MPQKNYLWIHMGLDRLVCKGPFKIWKDGEILAKNTKKMGESIISQYVGKRLDVHLTIQSVIIVN